MDLSKEFSFDQEMAENGVWIPIGGGASLRIARMNNERYNKFVRAAVMPYTRRGSVMTAEQNRTVLLECAAKAILLDWEGIKEDGVLLEYSSDQALRLMTEYEQFFHMVVGLAGDTSNFRKE